MDETSEYQPSLFSATGASTDARQVVSVDGDLSWANAHELIGSATALLAREPESLEVDLANVGMIDSSGLRALAKAHQMCCQSGVRFVLSSVSENVARMISISGFDSVFGLEQTGFPNRDTQAPIESHVRDSTWKVHEHIATSEPSVISILREKITTAATEAGINGEMFCDIQIAVGEALTNAYRHGSPEKGKNRIRLRYMVCPEALVVEVQDEGEPFDSNAIPEPVPNQMRDHGMGIYLMRQAMDVVEFRCGCPGNKVRMIKWLNKPAIPSHRH